MSKVVAIHNTVNERAWQHILAWEALHACDCANPRLKRFQGKPNEFSPKARLLNFLVSGHGCQYSVQHQCLTCLASAAGAPAAQAGCVRSVNSRGLHVVQLHNVKQHIDNSNSGTARLKHAMLVENGNYLLPA